MKRALHFLVDLVLGLLYGYLAGIFVYVVLLAVLLNTLKDRSSAQAYSFETGLPLMPLVAALKV